MHSHEIRRSFLDFFRQRGHEIVTSAPLVPVDDPTLLFTNAGMNQFKDVFLGAGKRSYSRAADTQKCLRAGGKHNDLEEVGYDTRHHTFFEMLGNWSFGDYYKSEAISWAWELLTRVWGLPPARLYASIFREDNDSDLLWRGISGLPPERIVRFDEKDNFWEMGETGPCGPCSEIHFDMGPAACDRQGQSGHVCRVNGDCSRIIEIWNLVFIQYERVADGSLRDLPARHVDTGMGFERIVAVLQGKHSTYDTDLFAPLLGAIEALTGRAYGSDARTDVSVRVVADHIRAMTFLISDGVLPANDGRGYVLRRILRRALRHGTLLGVNEPFLHRLAPVVADTMGSVFPELAAAREYVQRVVRGEEERFIATLRAGTARIEEIVRQARRQGTAEIPGAEVFQLYDTYGFPPDLARDALREQGLSYDQASYDAAMAEQRERARASWRGADVERDTPYRRAGLAELETRFAGYESLESESRVEALLRDGAPVEALAEGESGEAVLAETPFYAESGGQVGDRGTLEAAGVLARVTQTSRPHRGLVVHQVRIERGRLARGAVVRARVAGEIRWDTARNHTATHLLHAALRSVLGEHVKQAGSLVAPDRLRFDVTHFAALTPEEIEAVETLANRWVLEDQPVESRVMALDAALATGATALFGEKYGEQVRVVQVPGVSIELCGGTHLESTGQIGQVIVTAETSVSAGMRRIEAVTGRGALALARRRGQLLEQLGRRLGAPPEDAPVRVEGLLARIKELEKEVAQGRDRQVGDALAGVLQSRRDVAGVPVYTGRLDGVRAEDLRQLADRVRDQAGTALVVLAGAAAGKVLWIAAATGDLAGRVHAGKIVGQVARLTGGGGGGRPDMAQAGGKDPSRIDEALQTVEALVAESARGRVDG